MRLRQTTLADAPFLAEWLLEPGILRWFPMSDRREVEDAVRLWVGYSKLGCALTAEWEGVPCGMATLYLQPYKKLAHQCLFSIIVTERLRGRGIGKALLCALMKLGRETFRIELMHLEVYAGNPARELYQKLGFVEYGCQRQFIKENGEYIDKIMMQRLLDAEGS
jgi:putative acetyltransferase